MAMKDLVQVGPVDVKATAVKKKEPDVHQHQVRPQSPLVRGGAQARGAQIGAALRKKAGK